MRFQIAGLDVKTGKEVQVDVEASSQKEAFEIAKRSHAMFPKHASIRGGSRWVYKMVQIPPSIRAGNSDSEQEIAASYLQSVVNEYSEKGWEFYRVDQVGVLVKPGCLLGLLGFPAVHTNYYVVTFRQWVEV